jgi:hypothetical protein
MKSSVKVLATKSWDLVQRHNLYSCPDTQTYEYLRGADSLLLHSKRLNKSVLRFVDSEITLSPIHPDLGRVPSGLRTRLQAYLTEATATRGLLDEPLLRFYFLWPDWFQRYAKPESLETAAVLALWQEKDSWFRWPTESAVLQRGWTRDRNVSRIDCYPYEAELIRRLKQKNLKPDGRNNGPAILSFLMAGGERPVSGDEGWPIHHIYDGLSFIPYTQRRILHAVQDGEHFTHSGGLVALHPAAHFVAHQSELLAWLLRWEAFRRLKYDPNKIFSQA